MGRKGKVKTYHLSPEMEAFGSGKYCISDNQGLPGAEERECLQVFVRSSYPWSPSYFHFSPDSSSPPWWKTRELFYGESEREEMQVPASPEQVLLNPPDPSLTAGAAVPPGLNPMVSVGRGCPPT